MKRLKYPVILCCCALLGACENPVGDDLNVDDPESYTRVYTVNAADDSRNTLVFPLERDTSFTVYANLSGIRHPGRDIGVTFRVAPELVDAYNEKNRTAYPMMLDGSYTVESLESVIPNGEYISSPVRIAIHSRAFDGVGVFLLPLCIERVTPELIVNEALRTAYLRINGYYTENPFKAYDKSGWAIAGFSTEEPEATAAYPDRGRAASIIDGVNNTYWGTQWRNAKPGPPHWVAVDMGSPRELHGLTLRARAEKDDSDVPKSSGNPRIFTVDVSDDNAQWRRAGVFTVENRIENTVYFDHRVTARYFRITITATQADFYQGCLAEVWAF